MWTALPLVNLVVNQVLRLEQPMLEALATKSWEIAPAKTRIAPPSFALPGQLERVTNWAFPGENLERELSGGYVQEHAATRAFLVKNVVLYDGSLFKDRTCKYLHPRTSKSLVVNLTKEIDQGAIYATFNGNKYFGGWFMQDCLTYPIAANEGTPITTAQDPGKHIPQYEALLGMRPERQQGILLRRAILFQDYGDNTHKANRAADMRAKLIGSTPVKPHPGVFLIRGLGGVRRVLTNEMELATQMAKTRGLKVIDPLTMNASEIIAACAGAETVMGVEGSQLLHGLIVLAPGGRYLTLQPPDRFISNLKTLTDRDGQYFGYVVGHQRGEHFWIDPDDVERTMDLAKRLPS